MKMTTLCLLYCAFGAVQAILLKPAMVPQQVDMARAPSRQLSQKFDAYMAENHTGSEKPTFLRFTAARDPPYETIQIANWKTENLKLILGVMTMSTQTEVIAAHRRTWMKQPGVCGIDRKDDANCFIFPFFVYGDIDNAEITKQSDVVCLSKVPEPRDDVATGFQDEDKSLNQWKTSQLKTPTWFEYASTHFAWATHVGKMDLDTWPWTENIIQHLSKTPYKEDGQKWPIMYGRHFDGGFEGKGGMYGEFYAMSKDVVECFLKAVPKQEQETQLLYGENVTFSSRWFYSAEDQVLRTILAHEETDGSCPPMIDMSVQKSFVHYV